MSAAASPSQFNLLRQRRFAPFFWTQFLGAGNDNLLKFAFTVMVTYQLQVGWLPPASAGLVIGALFILPFLLFSATSGQVADKVDKAQLIRFVKWLEIGIMAVAAWGFIARAPAVLLVCVAAMGLHSTLFGPVKFAYLPQHLSTAELTGGNGMVEMGTFVAILLGNLAGGLLIALPQAGGTLVAVSCLALAALGRLAAQGIPPSPATDPALAINWNPFTETLRNLRLAARHAAVFRSLLGISWMWFFGAVFLSQFPAFAKDVLHGDERVASLLLVVFSIGIATGSLLCEPLGRRRIELGLVPIGAIGMSVFAIDLGAAAGGLAPSSNELGISAFLARPAHWRVLADLALLSLSAGLYSVPMYALVQQRTAATHRARVIAANNILNALFMVVSAVGVGALLAAGLRIPQVFLVVGILNALVATYVFLLVPDYLLRFLAFVLTRMVYRLDVQDGDRLPADGACLLVCNHVSYADPVLLLAASPRPITFLMDHRIFAMPLLGWVFRLGGAIPIAPERDDPAVYAAAFVRARAALDAGELVCIFPEGGLTHDGALGPFKGGVMKLLHDRPVPVVPMALGNLWGSVFSRRPRRGWPTIARRVTLRVGAAMPPDTVDPAALRQRVLVLLGTTDAMTPVPRLTLRMPPLSRAALVRIAPFALFMLLLAMRGWAQGHAAALVDARWIYGATVVLVGGLLVAWRHDYGELSRQLRPTGREAAVAFAVGLVVFALWIHLDAPWMHIGTPAATFAPLDAAGRLQWPLIAMRWCGAALLVPVMEELFWRSFLMRWIEGAPFERVLPQRVGVKAIVLSTFVFMLAHTLWLGAIVAGLAYALLYVRTGKLWLPVIAHAVTNGVLGVWVVLTGNWTFW